MTLTGHCLCGESTVEIDASPDSQIVCHCWDCKQTSGSAFSTNVLIPKKDVKITGAVKEFNIKAPSGNTVTRVFCSNCGSALSHLSVAFGDSQAIQTGNFREFATIPVGTELFAKDRWTAFAPVAGAAQVQAMP
ncbi:hypothetical protein CALCODRAFT_524711 [Calocera cornea HHB12733]|uniref:CENP-V/GFA domain-containing protein n=1 Tax=Calocera cornea HHB12733 TaxID=1353952 RepID=A0A165EH94_9BASI|nr:hypothetical protein CALCODRAFT_524711 [Calocera cornea HHB12733]